MHLRQLSPWNWFKKEDERSSSLPFRQMQLAGSGYSVNPLLRMHADMEKLIEDMFGQPFATPLGLSSSESGHVFIKPQLDIKENDERYLISVDVPGVEEKDLKLELDRDVLTISGERHDEQDERNGNYHKVERSFGRFQRVLALPSNASTEHVSAHFKNGVLNIELQKREDTESNRKSIAIN